MCSSGIRLGAWDYLRWKHIIPILNDKNELLLLKLEYMQMRKKNISRLFPWKLIRI